MKKEERGMKEKDRMQSPQRLRGTELKNTSCVKRVETAKLKLHPFPNTTTQS